MYEKDLAKGFVLDRFRDEEKKPCDMQHLLDSFIEETRYMRNATFCKHLYEKRIHIPIPDGRTQYIVHHLFSYRTDCEKRVFEIGIDPTESTAFLNIYDFNRNEIFHYEQNGNTGQCSNNTMSFDSERPTILQECKLTW